MKQFANYVDAASELKSEILAKTDLRDNRGALASLKQSWRECEAIVARGIKRGAEGLTEEAVDDPLAAHLQDSIERAFQDFYKWTLAATRRGCDSLLGRVRREFEKWSPSVLAALKVRSLATTTRGAITSVTRYRTTS